MSTSTETAPVTEEITTGIINVTPAIAKEWLALNHVNRPLREKLVKANADAMRAGLWQMNGEAVKFNISGHLVDGQHRLTALVDADVTLPMLVVWNVPDEAQATMDAGAKRSLADQLHLEGVSATTQTAAVIRLSMAWTDGIRGTRTKPPAYNHAILLQHLQQNPGLVQSATLGRIYASRMPSGMGATAVGFAVYLLAQIDREAMDTFMMSLADGHGLEKDSPILALRNRLIRTKIVGNTPFFQLSILLRAWNAWRENKTLTKFVLDAREGSLDRIVEPK